MHIDAAGFLDIQMKEGNNKELHGEGFGMTP
jgi:hypothetical protein